MAIDQSYIDFMMRERYNKLDNLLTDEVNKRLEYRGVAYDWRNTTHVTICWRPFMYTDYPNTELLMWYLENDYGHPVLERREEDFEFPKSWEDGNGKMYRHAEQAWDFEQSLTDSCYHMALQLQNRGLKTTLKRYHSKHSFTVANQLLTEKIKDHEANRQ